MLISPEAIIDRSVAFIDGREPPFVVNLFSTVTQATYGPGDMIDVRVQFSASVLVLEPRPTLALDVGTTAPVVAEYLEGNGTDTLVFTYIIQAGHATSDLSCFDRRALNTSGGKILLNSPPFIIPVNLTLPAYCGSLRRVQGIPNPLLVDGLTRPRVTRITSKKANGTYGAGEVIDLLVYFSRPVVIGGSPHIIMNTGGRSNSSAIFTLGGSVQRLDIGVESGAWRQNGGFSLSYQNESTQCIGWNETYVIEQAVYDNLVSLDSILKVGLTAVQAARTEKGYRLTFIFSSDFVKPVRMDGIFCGGNTEDLRTAPSEELVFR